nr:hypothetical protein [Tanacetum cinerariifolium]
MDREGGGLCCPRGLGSIADMSSASSAVTYTSVYTDSELGRVFWGADEELSDGGSSRVIVYGYDGLPMLPVAPASPDYIPGPEEPQTSPAPHDEDEHELIQPHDPDFDPEEYEDDETEDGPVDHPMDEGDDGDDDNGDSSGYDADDEDEDDEDEEEEEYLAPADSAVVIPTDELVSPPKGIEPIIQPPSTDTATIGARITIRPQTFISVPPEAKVERLLAMPTPSPSPLTSLSPPSAEERLARCTTPVALPSPSLPPSLYPPPPVDRRDDIPESEQPPRKRLCLSTLGSRDTWIDPEEAVPDMALRPLRGSILELQSLLSSTSMIPRTYMLYWRMLRMETIWIVEEDAYAAREAWAHSIGLSQTVHHELQTLREQLHETHSQIQQTEMAGLRETDRVRQSQIIETLRVMRDTRREMGDMRAELLALRGQPRRAGQPRGDVRVPNHQDAPRDADSHI